MSAMASQINSLTIVYSSLYSGADQRKHQSSASLAFDRRIHRWPENSPHKGPVTRKIFRLDDVIMRSLCPRSSFWRWFLTYSIFSCEQAAPRRLLSVCPSVRKRFFKVVTPLWIHPWLWYDAQSLKQHRVGALLFLKVIHRISRSYGTKNISPTLTRIGRFRNVTPVWIDWWLWNDAQSLRRHRRGVLLLFKVICQISRSHGTKNSLILTRIECVRTVTSVSIHWWLWNYALSLI